MHPQTSNFDFSGIEQFIKIAQSLRANQFPSAEEWDVLLQTPGYAALTQSEFPREFFINQFTLVLQPERAYELSEKLKTASPYVSSLLQHYLEVAKQLEKLPQYINLLADPTLGARALKRTLAHLPMSEIDLLPPVSFVIFDKDARGYSPVVIDLFFAVALGEELESLLAHEYHHFYRNRLLTFNPNLVETEDTDVIWAINQIHAEGVADLIDKKWWVDAKITPRAFPWAEKYREFVAEAPDTLSNINQLFEELASQPTEWQSIGQRLRKAIPMSGHPTGFFMANTIYETVGVDPLRDTVADPFAFFALYQQITALRSDNYPIFSEKTLDHLGKLHRKYRR